MLRTRIRRLRFGRVRSRRSRTISDPPTPRYLNWRYRPRFAFLWRPLKWILVGPEDRFGVRFGVFFALSLGHVHHVRGGFVGTHQDLCKDHSSCHQEGFVEGSFTYHRRRVPRKYSQGPAKRHRVLHQRRSLGFTSRVYVVDEGGRSTASGDVQDVQQRYRNDLDCRSGQAGRGDPDHPGVRRASVQSWRGGCRGRS